MLLVGEGDALRLTSYDQKRGDEHRWPDAQQVRGFRDSAYSGKVKDAVMNVAACVLPNIGTMIQGSDDLQQLMVAYF